MPEHKEPELRVIRHGINYSVRLVEYDDLGNIESVDDDAGVPLFCSMTTTKDYYQMACAAFSKPEIDFDSLGLHQRGHWFQVNGRWVQLADLKEQDIPTE
jgi:hypothetical protein